jgi:mRNA interferase YafQ
MRTIDVTSRYRRDYRRVASGPHVKRINAELAEILRRLQHDEPLDTRHSDHALIGAWQHYRDCHVLPDLVLIYKKVGDDRLVLARLASHSELDF